ncbi:MAG: fused MFS/spermidine synthase [Candidatus Hydrogenedentes bacterium]|nr:fused MFS/spermidine synthase [Candidatus Hydrogenedentota bacterium]
MKAALPVALERTVIYAVVFVSGGAGMAFEILGSRVLAPDFGSTMFVWGSLISVFLFALCLGYSIGGRLSEKADSLALLGIMTLAPAVLLLSFPLYGFWVSGLIFDQDMGARLGPLVASCCLFFLPTIFFGTITPLAVSLLASPRHGAGRSAGDVFAISTTGSIIGTLGTSFFLILWIGTKACLVLLGALLLALSIAALGYHLLARPQGQDERS